MPVTNPYAPNAFQQQAGNIMSPSTISALPIQSGTPFDIISRYAAGEQAKKSDAARQALETQRYEKQQQDVDLARALEASRHQEKLDFREEKIGIDAHAAQVKREHDIEMKQLDIDQKNAIKLAKAQAEKRKIDVLRKQHSAAFAGVDTEGMTFTEAKTFIPSKTGQKTPRIGLSSRTSVMKKIEDAEFGDQYTLGDMAEKDKNDLANALSTRSNQLQVDNKISQDKADRLAFEELVEGRNPSMTLSPGGVDAGPLWFDKEAFISRSTTPTTTDTPPSASPVAPEIASIKAAYRAGEITREVALKKIEQITAGGKRAN